MFRVRPLTEHNTLKLLNGYLQQYRGESNMYREDDKGKFQYHWTSTKAPLCPAVSPGAVAGFRFHRGPCYR